MTSEIPGLPAAAISNLEAALKTATAGRELPLYRIMAYQLGLMDENGETLPGASAPPRLHGELAMASAQAAGGEFRAAVPCAVAVELISNFWQIHVDVEDGNTERAGRPSVWWTWGPAQAINAGDGMHALARLALFSLRGEGLALEDASLALRLLDEATLRLCEGEYLDITYQERLKVQADEYLTMAEARSGALFGCAAHMGASMARLTVERASLFGEFGTKLGLARQVALDIEAFWGKGQRDQTQQGRLIAKKKSLPLTHALSSADATTRRKLGDLYVQRVLDPEAIKAVAEMLDGCGSRRFAEDTLARLLADADAALTAAALDRRGTELLRALARRIATARA